MNRELVIGAFLLGGGLAGYVVGLGRPFPGRAFTITAIMVGLLLVSVGRSLQGGALS